MILDWRGGVAVGCKEAIAAVYGCAPRTVRTYCPPIDYDRKTRRALYDILGCEELLAGVIPRPDRTTTAARLRDLGLDQDGRPLRGSG